VHQDELQLDVQKTVEDDLIHIVEIEMLMHENHVMMEMIMIEMHVKIIVLFQQHFIVEIEM